MKLELSHQKKEKGVLSQTVQSTFILALLNGTTAPSWMPTEYLEWLMSDTNLLLGILKLYNSEM